MRILLVDDDEGVLKTLDMVFTLFGYRTEHASCGVDALAWVQCHSFDLVVLDVNMPGMTGIEVLQQLQENPETSRIPVMILSGESEPIFKRRAMEAGATEYLSKPFELLAFRQAVDRVCKIEAQLNAMPG